MSLYLKWSKEVELSPRHVARLAHRAHVIIQGPTALPEKNLSSKKNMWTNLLAQKITRCFFCFFCNFQGVDGSLSQLICFKSVDAKRIHNRLAGNSAAPMSSSAVTKEERRERNAFWIHRNRLKVGSPVSKQLMWKIIQGNYEFQLQAFNKSHV